MTRGDSAIGFARFARPCGPDAGGVIEDWIGRWLTAWVDAAGRHARAVLLATAVATVALAVYTATHLGINTRHTALLDASLPFWRDYNAFAEHFPILDEALIVVIDAESADEARRAADVLAARLAEEPERFTDVYVPGGGDFFERHALLYLSVGELEDLSDQLAELQPLLAELARDRSLRNLAGVLTTGIAHVRTDPETAPDFSLAFDSLSTASEAVLEGRPRPVSWTELLIQRSLPGESSRRVLLLQPVFDYESLLPGRAAMDAVRAAAAELSLTPEHGIRVRITGNVALNTEEMVTVAEQAVYAALGSFVLVGGVLFAALRSRRLVAAILVTLLVGLVWTAAFAALAVGHLNVISVAFAVLFIGLGVDFGIHLGMRYAELERAGDDCPTALREMAQSVGGSLVLCALTTALGFYVFVPTDYRAAGELGLISGTGMLLSLFASLTVLPAWLALFDPSDTAGARPGPHRFTLALVSLAAHHARPVRAAAALLGLGSLAFLPSLRFDHNISTLRDPATESVQTFDDLLADSHTSPWTIDVAAPDLAAAGTLASRLRELRVVERAVTLDDYVPEDQEQKLEILADTAMLLPEPPREQEAAPPSAAEQIEALRALQSSLEAPWLAGGDPERAASARRAARQLERFLERLATLDRPAEAQVVGELQESLTGTLPRQLTRLWDSLEPDRVTLANLPADLTRRMLAPGGEARVEVLPREDLGDNAAHARFVDEVRAAAPGATGSAVSLLEWGRAVVRSFQQALATACVAVVLLLWLLWRRIGDVALAVAPLLLAAALTGASAVLLDIPFNFGNVVVLPLLLGIGIDSGIHLVHRHRVALDAGSTGEDPAAELLGTSTAEAVFFSALTTMGSFGTLALSSHRGLASLGQLLLLGMIFTLLANLVLLPALIARPPARRKPATRSPDF